MRKKKLPHQKLNQSQKEDIRLAASKMKGVSKREFQAEMTIKYCGGSPRLSETVFGWNRKSVKLGLEEKRTGITCVGTKKGKSGRKSWEEKNPEVAKELQKLVEEYAQKDPTFKSTIAYTRLTAFHGIKQLSLMGYSQEQLPKQTTMNEVLKRMGYRLRKVVKAKPKKTSRNR